MEIHVLNEDTINKIAAGEVVERPSAVAKELIENAMDAGATAITCEIRDGGISLLRVTDNGSGIAAGEVQRAFLRHATSKIRDEKDLSALQSLGFRGEALSSIAAVAQVEMITRTGDSIVGIRATNLPSPGPVDNVRMQTEEIGAPQGTTVIVRNLFYNVPVRKKFLKTAQTEAGYITDLVQRMALSHPDISFHYRVNGQDKLHTTGNGNLKEVIYRIFGKEVSKLLVPVAGAEGPMQLTGYIAKPELNRGSRSQEIFFVNGRMLRSDLLSKALEEGYGTDLMQHRFPFAVLTLLMDPAGADVNVHPSKMEIRFSDGKAVFDFVSSAVRQSLRGKELIPEATPLTAKEEAAQRRQEESVAYEALKDEPRYEPFESARTSQIAEPSARYGHAPDAGTAPAGIAAPGPGSPAGAAPEAASPASPENAADGGFVFEDRLPAGSFEQQSFFAPSSVKASPVPELAAFRELASEEEFRILTPEHAEEYRIVGQIFGTYWIVEFRDTMLLIDQHAAHEKCNYEHILRRLKEGGGGGMTASQMLAPPIAVSLSGREEAVYEQYADLFTRMGYDIDPLGESAYAIRGIPLELFGCDPKQLFQDTLDELLSEKLSGDPDLILSKIATMSCKAAVKGGWHISEEEARAMIRELLTLEDPYHCPHGRPTMIRLSRYEIERKIKRIV